MPSGVSLFFLGLLCCPFILHWALQYRHRLEECQVRHYVNYELLSHQVCADASYRQRFGEKIDCKRAEAEVAMGRYLCAWKLWKDHDFEPYAWFVVLFNSNWLYFILFGAVLMAIWAYFQKSRDLAMQRQHMDWCAQSIGTLMDRPPPPPSSLPPLEQKRLGWKRAQKPTTSPRFWSDGRRVPSARRVARSTSRHRRRRRPMSQSSSSEDDYSID